MPKFIVFTHVHNGFDSIAFKPGDIVPDWAIGKVNKRVHDGADSDESLEVFEDVSGDPEASLGAEEQDETPVGEVENAAEDESADATESDETGGLVESGEPDFTKPAPAKRGPGRPRKSA